MKTLKEMRERLEVINGTLTQLGKVEKLTAEDLETIEALSTETDTLNKQIVAKERLEAHEAKMNKPQPKANNMQAASGVVLNEPRITAKNGGFESAGEFYNAVKNIKTDYDRRFSNEVFSKTGEDGGFLIPTDFVGGVTDKLGSDESLLAKTDTYQTRSNRVSFNVDESAAWDSASGVQAYWLGEGKQYTESKPILEGAEIKLHKIGALVHVTEEALEDAPFLASLINKKAPEAIMHKVNSAILSGTGAGKPRGIIGHPFAYEQAKKAGQAAATIVYDNVAQMSSRLIPSANGIWVANPGCRPQLKLLKDDNGNFIYMNGNQYANASVAGFDTLDGKQILYMMGGTAALGSVGDFMLIDFSKYTTITKTNGMKSDISTHVKWLEDKTSFKFSMRVGGDCLFNSPVTPENGNFDMSGFVSLAVRS